MLLSQQGFFSETLFKSSKWKSQYIFPEMNIDVNFQLIEIC
jgi:hypothetical protein